LFTTCLVYAVGIILPDVFQLVKGKWPNRTPNFWVVTTCERLGTSCGVFVKNLI